MIKNNSLERYSRHIVLKQIGGQGQKLLKESKVLIIGIGGLGSPVLQYLASSGIGEIGLADDDKIDISNLHRQTIFSMKDIGLYKVSKGKSFIKAINPDIKINVHRNRISKVNAEKIIKNYDLIIDCTDNHLSRLIINDMCFEKKKILVSASIAGFFGQVSTYKAFEKDNNGVPNPSYRCLKIKYNDEGDCDYHGVLGSVAGIIGSIQATEVIKQIVREKEDLVGKLLIFDGLSYKMKLIKINWDPSNPLNGTMN